ncbi:uncharacterized protein LOC106160737 isoform X2 [Lingula anatina]|uniref:Uncharacterized protein LOC106160737 isoform X2 n=1 Tax=Lingula anatina TaxID=7574 RepID=A0A1S3I3L9_LINAN|nr:uncharacterized protein LOC106160737 isoform X2 [Lingula anatina]|eukprot:XP_013392860.1 uncharacterized protein LOC106160737 isoform X2 [Lingula anatina]
MLALPGFSLSILVCLAWIPQSHQAVITLEDIANKCHLPADEYGPYTEFCRKCIEERNGVGHYEFPCDCKYYLQCTLPEVDQQKGTTLVKAAKRQCPPGTLYDRGAATCVHCSVAQCIGSRLVSETPPFNDVEGPLTPAKARNVYSQQCQPKWGGSTWPVATSCEIITDLDDYFATDVSKKRKKRSFPWPPGCCCTPGMAKCRHRTRPDLYVYRICSSCWTTNCEDTCWKRYYCSMDESVILDTDKCLCVAQPKGPIVLFDFEYPMPFISVIDAVPADAVDVHIKLEPSWSHVATFGSLSPSGGLEISRFNLYNWGNYLTVTFRYKPEEPIKNEDRELINNGNCEYPPSIRFYTHGKILRCRVRSGGYSPQTANLELPTSSHVVGVVLTYKYGSLALYIKDGSNEYSKGSFLFGYLATTPAPLNIGGGLFCNNGCSLGFLGWIDDVQVYDRVLSPSEITRTLNGETNILG